MLCSTTGGISIRRIAKESVENQFPYLGKLRSPLKLGGYKLNNEAADTVHQKNLKTFVVGSRLVFCQRLPFFIPYPLLLLLLRFLQNSAVLLPLPKFTLLPASCPFSVHVPHKLKSPGRCAAPCVRRRFCCPKRAKLLINTQYLFGGLPYCFTTVYLNVLKILNNKRNIEGFNKEFKKNYAMFGRTLNQYDVEIPHIMANVLNAKKQSNTFHTQRLGSKPQHRVYLPETQQNQ